MLNGTKALRADLLPGQRRRLHQLEPDQRLPHWFGGDAFVQLQQTNMFGSHIHLVKFDVTSSDGASNGWNYQQAAFTKDQADFNQQVLNGTEPCNPEPGGARYNRPADLDVRGDHTKPPGRPSTSAGTRTPSSRTVFTHDHHFPAVDQNRGLFGALLVEPRGWTSATPDGHLL